jgi:hypothetical protein
VPVRGPGFNGAFWVAATRARTLQAQTALRARRAEPSLPAGERALLPLLAATLTAQRAGERRSTSEAAWESGTSTSSALRVPGHVKYVVVETDEVSAVGRAIFGDDKSIRFVSGVPGAGRDFRIVHVNSALQYIEDYRGLIRQLAAIGAEFVLFVNLSAGEVPTYETAQLNVSGSVLAYWFLNLDEVIALPREEGYSLVMKTGADRHLRGFSVPREYRLDHGTNLLFARAKGS